MQPSALPLFLPVGMLVNVKLVLSLPQPPSLESILWKNTVLLPGCPSFLILVRAMQQELGSVPCNSDVSMHRMPVEELFCSLQGIYEWIGRLQGLHRLLFSKLTRMSTVWYKLWLSLERRVSGGQVPCCELRGFLEREEVERSDVPENLLNLCLNLCEN